MIHFFLALFLVLLSSRIFAENTRLSSAQKKEIYKLVSEHVDENDIVGLSFAITDKNGTLYKDAVGFANRAEKEKTTTKTVYPIGSMTKTYSATAIMQLHESGQINIDNQIGEYLPQFSINSRFKGIEKDFSIRNMLTHHSGLPSDYLKRLNAPDPWPLDSLLIALQDEYQPIPSNKLAVYSNVTYSLLGILISEISGMTYEEYVKKHILKPLGMHHSAFSHDHPNVKDLLSKGHRGREQRMPYTMRERPAGGLLSNVEDMAAFIRMFLNGGKLNQQQILSKASIEEMWTVQNDELALDFDMRIGLGWYAGNQSASNYIQSTPIRYHTGSTILYCNIMMLAVDKGIGVIVMENTARKNSATNRIGNAILAYTLNELYGLEEKPGHLTEKVSGISKKLLENMPGAYATDFGFLEIRRRGNRLHADLAGRKFRLMPHENETFGIRFRLLGFIPIQIGALKEIRFSYKQMDEKEVLLQNNQQGEEFYFGIKFTPQKPDEHWQKRIGDYTITDLGNDVQIIYDTEIGKKNDVLYLKFVPRLYENLPLIMPLRTVSDDKAIIEGLSRWQGDVVRFIKHADGSEKMRYQGYTFEKSR